VKGKKEGWKRKGGKERGREEGREEGREGGREGGRTHPQDAARVIGAGVEGPPDVVGHALFLQPLPELVLDDLVLA